MGRLVDTDDVMEKCKETLKKLKATKRSSCWYLSFDTIEYFIKKLLEVVPNYRALGTIKNGKWLMKKVYNEQGKVIGYNLNCSNCGFFWREHLHAKVFKFCPHCGAEMVDKEVTE